MKVVNIRQIGSGRVLNLTVQKNHTIVSANGIVTHNCDHLSINAQAALRNIMETYSQFTRFIITCNFPQKIIDPLKSRCQTFTFKEYGRNQILKTLASIMVKEKVKGTAEQLALIVDSCGSDVRKAINTLQFNVVNGQLQVSKNQIEDNDYKFKILKLMNEKKLTDVRELVDANMIQDYTDIFKFLIDRKEDITVCDPDDAHLIIAEYMYRSSFMADQWVNFSACMLEIMKKK